MQRMTATKERLYFRIPVELRHKLDARLQGNETTITALMERYITEGLARDAGELIEESSLPAVSQAVRIELKRGLEELRASMIADLQKAARRSDDRLAALIVKAARSAGIGWRLAYANLAKVMGTDQASQVYEDAKEKVAKEIARPDESNKAREEELKEKRA